MKKDENMPLEDCPKVRMKCPHRSPECEIHGDSCVYVINASMTRAAIVASNARLDPETRAMMLENPEMKNVLENPEVKKVFDVTLDKLMGSLAKE